MVADYVIEYLAACGVRDVFTVSGGGIMYLLDALGRSREISYWCNYHEQACVMAAEAYARVTGDVGVCLVTTGPGSTNALSAVAGAWVDSVPVVVISGQVRTDLIADYSKHRQIGPQEIDIIDMARPVTKYAKTLLPGDDVRAELAHAVQLANTGRPGPVWLNIPLDVQGGEIAEIGAEASARVPGPEPTPTADLIEGVREVTRRLRSARRPVVVCGDGIHLAGAEPEFSRFVERVDCPVVATMGGMDLLPEEHPLYLGRFGPTGQRRANFTLQNADLLLCLGTSMAVTATGFDTSGFAPKARRVMVNIDPEEMRKPHFPVDFGLAADIKAFLVAFLHDVPADSLSFDPRWNEAVQRWKRDYPIVTADYFVDKDHVNGYVLAAKLSDLMAAGDVVLTGNGADSVVMHHSFAVKPGQRVIANYGFGAMGWDLPAAIGACVARGGAHTVLVTGDGSFQFNVQELLTIGFHHLDVKIFVLNNGGYGSIRATQENFFEGRFVGCHSESGVANPRFDSLAQAYGLRYELIRTNAELEEGLSAALQGDDPCVCEVNVSFSEEKSPRTVTRRREDGTLESGSLDDQYPFLPREEHKAIMSMFADDEEPHER
jgi:acetolactate synthase-1/2/3 large subunit